MLEIGSIIDNKYKILAEVGHGGQSRVYLALNERANKQWAIKEILNKEDTSLITELSILKGLNNPHLPSIVDVLETEDSLLIIMDYVEGITLQRKLKEEGPLPQKDVVDYMMQLCDVFTYLHEQQPPIIYRDLKPSNIMLKPDGTVVLIDFGAARTFKELNTEDTTPLGTPGYAAPEQYEKEQTDARTDVYTIGTTMFNLLTGKLPHLTTSKSITAFSPSLSTGLDMIIQKCTNPDKKERYQTCVELKRALSHYEFYDIQNVKRRRRRKILIAAAAVLIAVCIAGVIANVVHDKQALKENYEYYIRMASSSENSEDYYIEAIKLDPDNEEAYLLLLESYLEDNEFSSDEAQELVEVLGYSTSNTTNESALKTNTEGYDNFAFQVGLAYYYYYTNGRTMSESWFEIAKDSEYLSDSQIRRAEILYEIAGYYSQLNSLNLAGDYDISYSVYWEDITSFLNYNLVEEDNFKTAIVTYNEIVSQIISNADKFQSAAVTQEDMEEALSLIEKHIETDVDTTTLSDSDSETLSQLLSDISSAKEVIVATFQETE